MKQIILIRHAKVDIASRERVDTVSLLRWIQKYDTAPLCSDSLPSDETMRLAKDADILITSSLSRAIDSAKILGVEVHEQNSLFNEAAIPEIRLPFLRLRPRSWLVVLRMLLLFGFGKEDTSLRASKERAKKAAQKVLELSREYNHVVVVGHGGMNWLIGKVLTEKGWKLEGKRAHSNWGTSVFEKA